LEGAEQDTEEKPTNLKEEAAAPRNTPDASSAWLRSNLDDAALQEVQTLLAKLRYSRLLNAELGEDSLEDRLREIADRKNLREISDPEAATPTLLPVGHAGEVNALALLPNGLLASGGGDGAVRIWEVDTSREVRVLEGHRGWVRALAALPEGLLASGGADGTVRIWNVDTGREVRVLKGHRDRVLALAAFSGGLLASGGMDGTVRIWNVQLKKKGEEEVKCFYLFRGEASAVFAQADSRGLLICAPSDGEPWRTRWVDGEELPADPLLHEVVRFVYEGYVLPLYRIPSRFEWAGPRGEKTRCIRLLWPEDSEFDWRRLS